MLSFCVGPVFMLQVAVNATIVTRRDTLPGNAPSRSPEAEEEVEVAEVRCSICLGVCLVSLSLGVRV